jgi:putative transposase
MILTYKVRHGLDLAAPLLAAKKVADYAVKHRTFSSRDVAHLGLKSIISNQILRKYGKSKTIKKVSRVNLIVPGSGVKMAGSVLRIPCLKFEFEHRFPAFEKVNQVELSKDFVFVSVTVKEDAPYEADQWIGVDLNATGHCAVAANPATGRVMKLGKQAQHVRAKFKNQRKYFQKKQKFGVLKKVNNKEQRVMRDVNHKIARRLVDEAVKTKAGIVLEDLKGIRKTKKQAKSFRGTLHSWSYFQLKTFIEYKAKLRGVPVAKIDPRYTSQQCSRCGQIGARDKKEFKCRACGHVAHADINAAFVIALRHSGGVRLPAEKDVGKGSTDAPRKRRRR